MEIYCRKIERDAVSIIRTAFITGGGSGIGAAIAADMQAKGFNVVISDINANSAREVADKLNGNACEAKAFAVQADVSDHAENVAALDAAKAQFGDISVLVNNAGWDRLMNFSETTPDFWDKVIEINLRGPIGLTHAAIPQMRAAGYGRIINIASDAGRVGSSGEAVYSACKGGMIAFAKTLARELARENITANAVCPGPTDTALLNAQLGEGEAAQKIYDGLKRSIPMKRLGQPADICGIVSFLASTQASFITGQTISVSGGLTMQ